MIRLVALTTLAALAAGCSSTYRGIPSHGGGKRFSEEQRVVTGAIRQAVATMDLKELKGKRVALKLTGIPSSGGGNINWGGWTASVDGYDRESLNVLNRITKPSYNDTTENDSAGFGGRLSFRPNNNFYASAQNTNADVNYLQAALEMKALHSGIRFTSQKPDATLYVLVDVLGTNRSRTNWLVIHDDELKAECELSYYAVNTDNQQLCFRSRRASAEGTYSHTRCIVAPIKAGIQRSINATTPTPLPDGSDIDAIIPKNGGDHSDTSASVPAAMNGKQKERHLKSLANRLRSQINSGDSKEARETLRQIVTIDPGYEELPELKQQFKDKP